MRVLVTVSPLMYRQAIALALHRHRPDFEVRVAPSEAAEEEAKAFEPHLLVHNDNDGLTGGFWTLSPFGSRCATRTAWTRR